MSDEQKTTAPEGEVQETETQTPAAQATEATATEASATEAQATEAPASEAPATEGQNGSAPAVAESAPKPTVSLRERTEADDFDDDDDSDDDADDDFEGDDDDNNYAEGPAEYVQREKSGRARRIGSDIRVNDIDYKNIPMLSRFLDRRGRILSRRKTKVNAKVQRSIVKAIKRARHLALLPYTGDHTRIVQKRGR